MLAGGLKEQHWTVVLSTLVVPDSSLVVPVLLWRLHVGWLLVAFERPLTLLSD